MSVAKCLGVDDVDCPQMMQMRSRWPQWSEVEPGPAVVDDPVALPRVMRRSEPEQRDTVLGALLRLGVVEQSATVALVWLLAPGATKLAWRLRDLSRDIDELVAGQLWIQVREHDPDDARYVAAKILNRTEREVMVELAVGDLAKRRDPTWAKAVLTDRFDESIPDQQSDTDTAHEELHLLLARTTRSRPGRSAATPPMHWTGSPRLHDSRGWHCERLSADVGHDSRDLGKGGVCR